MSGFVDVKRSIEQTLMLAKKPYAELGLLSQLRANIFIVALLNFNIV